MVVMVIMVIMIIMIIMVVMVVVVVMNIVVVIIVLVVAPLGAIFRNYGKVADRRENSGGTATYVKCSRRDV
jgi:uncharacterized membrane protein